LTLLEVKDLIVNYSTGQIEIKALNGIELSVNTEVVGIVGESGSGKSTLGLSVIGLLASPPAKYLQGSVMYKGIDLLKVPQRMRRYFRGTEISMIFQEPLTSLNPVLTIGDQLAESIRVRKSREEIDEETLMRFVSQGIPPKLDSLKLKSRDLRDEVIEALRTVRIPDPDRIYRSYPHELSGGMRQRVMIAMALSERPSVLIADEPTSALDVTTQAEILQLIKELVQKSHTAVIFITHDLAVVGQIADRVAVMYAGEVVEEAAVDELFSTPKHPYTTALLASFPSGYKTDAPTPFIQGNAPDLSNPPSGCKFHPRCRWAFERCVTESPEMMRTSEKHLVACHLYGGEINAK